MLGGGEERVTGRQLVQLAFATQRWISRRNETYTFEDDRTVRCDTTYDITLARGTDIDPKVVPRMGNRLLLPVASHPRFPHQTTILTDGNEVELPHLSRADERRLVAAGIADLALGRVGRRDRVPFAALHETLYRRLDPAFNAGAPHHRHDSARESALLAPLQLLIDNFQENRLIVAMPRADALLDGPIWHRRPERFRVVESYSRPLWLNGPGVLVPYGPDVETPWNYWFRATNVRYAGGEQPHEPTSAEVNKPWDRKPCHDDLPIVLRTSGTEVRSSHVEVRCPAGVFFDYGCLVTASLDTTTEGPGYTQAFILDSDPHLNVAHFYDSESFEPRLNGSQPSTPVRTDLVLVLRPNYHGQLRAGANVTIVTAILLFLMMILVAWPTADMPFSVGSIESADTNSVVSALLLVPTVALAFLIRDNEHRLIKSVLHAYRWRMSAAAASTLGLAVVYAAGLRSYGLVAASFVALIVVSVVAVTNWRSAGTSRRGEERWRTLRTGAITPRHPATLDPGLPAPGIDALLDYKARLAAAVEELEQLAAHCAELVLQRGTTTVAQGDPTDAAFQLLDQINIATWAVAGSFQDTAGENSWTRIRRVLNWEPNERPPATVWSAITHDVPDLLAALRDELQSTTWEGR